jgi:hypothetical protein
MLHVAPLERPMILAVCSRLSPISSGSNTACAMRSSSAVRADLNSFLASSIHSFPLAALLMIASCKHGNIIHDFIAKWNKPFCFV